MYNEISKHITNPTIRRAQTILDADDSPNPADSSMADSGSGEPKATPGEAVNYWKCCQCKRYNLLKTVTTCPCGHVTCWQVPRGSTNPVCSVKIALMLTSVCHG